VSTTTTAPAERVAGAFRPAELVAELQVVVVIVEADQTGLLILHLRDKVLDAGGHGEVFAVAQGIVDHEDVLGLDSAAIVPSQFQQLLALYRLQQHRTADLSKWCQGSATYVRTVVVHCCVTRGALQEFLVQGNSCISTVRAATPRPLPAGTRRAMTSSYFISLRYLAIEIEW